MKKLLLFCLFIFCVLFLNSCGDSADETDDPAERQYAENVILVESDIDASVTWSAGSVYLIDDTIRINANATLTIQPGTVVKFTAYGFLAAENGSRINAVGTLSLPVIFTSSLDDSHGGDSILNDGDSSPSAGDWNTLSIEQGAVGSFEYCTFLYGGKSRAAVLKIQGVADVKNSQFHDNLGGHPYLSGALGTATLDAAGATSGTTVTNTLFYRNSWPLSLSPILNLDGSNSFSFDEDEDPATSDVTNTYQAIFIDYGDISSSVSWEETEVPLCFFDYLLRVTSTGTLTIASGTVVKSSAADFQFEYGSTVTRTGVIFTSFRDDSLLGDTNCDGTASSPLDGDWVGIEVEDSGSNFTYQTRDNSGDIRYSLEG